MSSSQNHRQPFAPSLLRSVAIVWLLCGGVGALSSWAFLDTFGRSTDYALIVLTTSVLGALVIFCLSVFLKTPRRAIVWAFSVGFLLFPPLLASFGFIGLGYTLLVPHSKLVYAIQWAAFSAIAIVWIGVDFQSLRINVVRSRYLEREFTEHDDHVALRWERKTKIDVRSGGDQNAWGRVWNRFGPKLLAAVAPLSVAGYATSQVLSRGGGPEAVLLFLAVLGVPVFVYLLSRIVCGGYLNIYKVWQIERRTGKPVLFDEIPVE